VNVEPLEQIPSFVVAQIGSRRIALQSSEIAELILSPLLHTFPHATSLIVGVVLRRGRVLPVMDMGLGLNGVPSTGAKFYLVIERHVGNIADRYAIPVDGECELVSGIMFPPKDHDGFAIGSLDLSGEIIDVIDFEKTIARSQTVQSGKFGAVEALQ
jgi:chemotaxis signal transduction protein